MGKNYKIYKNGGYTYVHYDGFPKGVRIEKYETLYDYDWGWMTIGVKNGNEYYDFCNDIAELYGLMRNGDVIVKDGKYGMQDSNGKEILPCVFDQIEKLSTTVFGRLGNSYWELDVYRCGGTLRGDYSDTGFFVKDGKKGWQEDGITVIPALFDDIWHASGSNFYRVKEGNKNRYLDSSLRPVLTRLRIPLQKPDDIPFTFHSGRMDVLTLQEYVGHEDLEDSNVVLLNNVWQRLDRFSCRELIDMLIDRSDELPMTEDDLKLFNNDFSYEYAAYLVKSEYNKGISGCWELLKSMRINSNTWHYIVKVWFAEGEHPKASDLRYLRNDIEKCGRLGRLHFALGHDKSLSPGETKMLAITHYNERCWPALFEFTWRDDIDTCNFEDLKSEHRKLALAINKQVYPQYRQEVLQDQWNGSICHMRYSKARRWKETIKVLNWLSNYDKSFRENGVRFFVEDFSYIFCFGVYGKRSECDFMLKKLRWMLEKGSTPNYHYRCETALDIVQNGIKCYIDNMSDKDKDYIESAKNKCVELLCSHGAKTFKEIQEEESQNNDYKIELTRMGT